MDIMALKTAVKDLDKYLGVANLAVKACKDYGVNFSFKSEITIQLVVMLYMISKKEPGIYATYNDMDKKPDRTSLYETYREEYIQAEYYDILISSKINIIASELRILPPALHTTPRKLDDLSMVLINAKNMLRVAEWYISEYNNKE